MQILNGPPKVPTIPYRMEKKDKSSADLYFYDMIGSSWDGTTAKQLSKDLKDIGDVSTLNIFINSPGGVVFDGVAIYNMLKRYPATKKVQIDGMAASIASVVAMVGDTISIAKNGMMMIHDPWAWIDMFVQGDAQKFRQMAEMLMKSADKLDKIRDAIIATYAARTTTPEEKIGEMMTAETWMTAKEAVDLGFADSINDDEVEIAALSKHDLTTFKNVPERFSELLAQSKEKTAAQRANVHPETVIASAEAYVLRQRQSGPALK